MPKKWAGENSKAAQAKAKKLAAKQAESLKAQQQKEDEYWQDNDKHVLRKQQKKEEKERKKQEQSDKKEMLRTLLEQETMTSKQSSSKLTRYELQKVHDNQNAKPVQEFTHLTAPLEENLNRLHIDGEVARSVDEAISILSTEKADRHPEKRVKAAYLEFEALHLPRLKLDNPTLRLSQVKQLLKKEWLKSSQNPLNQTHVDHNSKL